MTQDDRDRAVLVLATALGTFLVVGIVAVCTLAISGHDIGNEWHDLFTLAAGALGAVAGYLAKSIVNRNDK